MAEVQKGVITQFSGDMPVVRPYGFNQLLTPPLASHIGQLYVGNVVAFVVFEDGTGLVLSKM